MSRETNEAYGERMAQMLRNGWCRPENPIPNEVCPLTFGVAPQGQRPDERRVRFRRYNEFPAQTTPILTERGGDWPEVETPQREESRLLYTDRVQARFARRRHYPGHVKFMDYEI